MRLRTRLIHEDMAAVREAYIARVRLEKGAIERLRRDMPIRGYEEVSDPGLLTTDGREVIVMYGKRWALRPDVHAQRRADSLAEAKRLDDTARAAQRHAEKPGESLTCVLCPSCKSVMAKAPVCPNCAKGKAGFKILCACTECGHEVYL